ncbi:MAG: AMP-binding protein [Acidimicrobiia bacterium]|nr:AMP-binding protein [Acidimicrobiia bacterium]
MPTAFLSTVREHGDAVALRWQNPDDSWGEWTWSDYAERVARAAAGFEARGIGRGDRIVLMMRNVPEFHVADMAAYFVGATPVSIYNSSSPEQVEYLANHCEAKLAIAENLDFLERFLKVRAELDVDHLGVVSDPDGLAPEDVFRWDDVLGRRRASTSTPPSTAPGPTTSRPSSTRPAPPVRPRA